VNAAFLSIHVLAIVRAFVIQKPSDSFFVL
jgi:hypothetical protein